jgi:putative exporter of polyketide antibiotics
MLILLAKLLDPISFVIAGLATLVARRWWHCVIVGVVVALVVEMILTSLQYTRDFGEGLIPGVIASSAHSAIAFWLISKRRQRKAERPSTA